MLKRSLLALVAFTYPAFADAPVIKNVNAKQVGDLWTFDVTLRHGDTGWDDYADAWRVLDKDGKVLGLRNLAHPHVNEQPFTRSLSGVSIPSNVSEVAVQARDSVGGWSPATVTIKLR
ncbi:hypothetical protein [Sulfitobacter mediterraneus]|jgi:hypothetical protein|uniref:hypothetical protein n=1 Tax=Sulfitobacter mediterraneus TaxID=83219 RepID=UPI000EA04A90|nr:hypothetical protein [Sulfitobacter mediterraneus]UWR11629.1 hypothetical protein K3753_01725 [Sulfitobacter mediterraneus]